MKLASCKSALNPPPTPPHPGGLLYRPLILLSLFSLFSAAWLAVRFVFPGISAKGCAFHWTQAVWRQVQDIGLKPAYSQRSSIYNYVRQLLALPFLPQNHIQPTFQHLHQRANTEQLQQLVNYIDRQWLRHTIFDEPSWCIFGSSIRTNNDVEGKYIRIHSFTLLFFIPFHS